MDWNVLFQNCNLLIYNKFLIYFNKKNNFKKAQIVEVKIACLIISNRYSGFITDWERFTIPVPNLIITQYVY